MKDAANEEEEKVEVVEYKIKSGNTNDEHYFGTIVSVCFKKRPGEDVVT